MSKPHEDTVARIKYLSQMLRGVRLTKQEGADIMNALAEFKVDVLLPAIYHEPIKKELTADSIRLAAYANGDCQNSPLINNLIKKLGLE